MVRAREHPDFEEEDLHLQNTLAVINGELRQTLKAREATPAYRDAYKEIRRLDSEYASNMRQALAQPYFARVDFTRDGVDSTQVIYIGKFGVNGPDRSFMITDWRAPIAQLYYNQQWQDAKYTVPGKGQNHSNIEICGNITLRRKYKIRSSHLDEIEDERRPPSALIRPPSNGRGLSDEIELPISRYLHNVLADSRTAKLPDIVATIQPEQYSLIEAPLRGVLVIQGVAGSGKTSMALHRLAYLLYPHPHQDIVAASRMLVIGPSAVFLRSISDILPALGVQGIRQTTFADWAQVWLNRTITIESRNTQLERLIDPVVEKHVGPAEHRLLVNAALFLSKFKGSMRMASLLRAHIIATKKSLPLQARSISVAYTIPEEQGLRILAYTHSSTVSLTVSAEEVGKIVEQVLVTGAPRDLRLGVLRDRCVDSVIGYLWQQFQIEPLYGRPHQSRDEKEEKEWEQRDSERLLAFRAAIKESIQNTFNEWWPTVTPVNCYRSLIVSRDRLIRAASEAERSSETPFHEWELELLFAPEAQRRDYHWSEDDLAPLCYTALILNGPREEQYDHIFVDEVQDLSPLAVYLLHLHAKGGSMTLVGDIAQRVGWSGIHALSDIDAVLDKASITHAVIDISYRSTYEITNFANRLLGQLPSPGFDGLLARPVSRHGPAPDLTRCSSRHELLTKAADLVIDARNRGSHSIAIICKTSRAAKDMVVAFRSRSIPIPEGVAIIPVHLAKGLEFDTVLVMDADDRTYTYREHDIRLLYVAVTRALHDLHLLWVGNVSPMLAYLLEPEGE